MCLSDESEFDNFKDSQEEKSVSYMGMTTLMHDFANPIEEEPPVFCETCDEGSQGVLDKENGLHKA